MAIRKRLKEDYGGGMREFHSDEQTYFDEVSDPDLFFTSQERQSIVRHILYELRASKGERFAGVRFREGQPIGKK